MTRTCHFGLQVTHKAEFCYLPENYIIFSMFMSTHKIGQNKLTLMCIGQNNIVLMILN